MKLESINELLNYLNPNLKDWGRTSKAMKSLDVTQVRLKPYTFWSKDNYTRNLISKTEAFELFICCWEPGQGSVYHDLNGQDGWMKCVEGVLDVEVISGKESLSLPESSRKVKSTQLAAGDLYEHNSKTNMYRIVNNSGKRAISLHLNSMPISYYNVISGKGSDVDLINIEYHSINGNLI